MNYKVEHERSTRRDDPAWWTWLEAEEWVAFQGAEPSLPWPPGWVWRNLDCGTLAAVAARADTSLRRGERIWKPERKDWSGQSYRQRAKLKWWLRALRDAGVPVADLPARTRELAEAARTCHTRKAAASSDLLASVQSGRLPIYGQRPLPDGYGNPTRDPAGEHDSLPVKVFANPKLIVEGEAVTVPTGSPEWWRNHNRRVASGHGRPPAIYPLYIGVRFWVQDVRRLWPASQAQLAAREDREEEAKRWMVGEAQRLVALGWLPKRDAIEKDCREATKCNTTESRAAWEALPDGLRRRRGETDQAVSARRTGS